MCGVLEVGRGLDLGEESFRADQRRELGFEHLERDRAGVLQVLGEVDDRHAALAELPLDGVAVLQRSVQARDGIGHRGVPGR